MGRQSHAALIPADAVRPAREARTSPLAIASLVIATLSFLILPLNLVAVFFGLVSRRSIRRSRGRLQGEALAVAGIVVGSVSLVVCTIATAIVASNLLATPITRAQSTHPPGSLPISASVEPPSASAPAPTFTHADRQPVRGGKSEQHRWQQLIVSDLDPEVVSLQEALDDERRLAKAASREPVLLLVSADCTACAALQNTLKSPQLERAAARLWIVRLDVRQFEAELQQLGVPTEHAPSLVLLSASNNPLDYIHSGEWAGVAEENIAPLVNDFLAGRLRQRKDPWRGPRRDGETPI